MAEIGIVTLDNRIPRPLGDVGNAATFSFPVTMAVSLGADTRRVVERASEGLLPAVTATATWLQDGGVAGVTTCCGFLAAHQRELADTLDVPVATSSLLQVPLVLQTLRQDQSVCVVTANARTLDSRHLEASGIGKSLWPRVHVVGLEHTAHLYGVLIGDDEHLDGQRAEAEVMEVARLAVESRPDVGAFVLECTNLPPYREAIKAGTGLPVWDARALIDWLHTGVTGTAAVHDS